MTKDGEVERLVPITGISSNECPVSRAHFNPEISALVDDVITDRFMKDRTGAWTFGPDISEWPSRWFDGVYIAQTEELLIDECRENNKPMVL